MDSGATFAKLTPLVPRVSFRERAMGIHRINRFFVSEFGSPGDLRFRSETDIRIPLTPDNPVCRLVNGALSHPRKRLAEPPPARGKRT